MAGALLWCVPGLLSPSGAVAPRRSLAPGSGCKELRDPPWLCVGAVPMGLCPGRALGVPHCSPVELGTVTEDGERKRIPCRVVAPSAISFPTGSVRREELVVGAASSSVGAAEGPPPRPLPRLAGDGPWLPVAASAAPVARGGPASVPAPCPPVGPVPSLPVWAPHSVLGGSAVPGGVPGKGSSSASICSHVVAFGVGNCPAPAPCCGSVGRGRGGGMLSGADPRASTPRSRHGTGTWSHAADKGLGAGRSRHGRGGTCPAALACPVPLVGAGGGSAQRGAGPAAKSGAEPHTALHDHCRQRGEEEEKGEKGESTHIRHRHGAPCAARSAPLNCGKQQRDPVGQGRGLHSPQLPPAPPSSPARGAATGAMHSAWSSRGSMGRGTTWSTALPPPGLAPPKALPAPG